MVLRFRFEIKPTVKTVGRSSRAIGLLVSILWFLVLCSALSVVYISHNCRELYGDLSSLEQEKNSLQVEWGKYLLEQSSWAALSRIEQLAGSRLKMRTPHADEIVLVRQ